MPGRKAKPDPQRRQRSIDAVALFTMLMHAVEQDRPTEAAEARAALRRLGVVVRVLRPCVVGDEP